MENFHAIQIEVAIMFEHAATGGKKRRSHHIGQLQRSVEQLISQPLLVGQRICQILAQLLGRRRVLRAALLCDLTALFARLKARRQVKYRLLYIEFAKIFVSLF